MAADTTEQTPVAHVDELLQETRSKMEAELEELRAPHEAYLRVEQILSNFDTITSARKVRKGGNGTRAPRGSRTLEFLNLVMESGENGITVADAVEKMDGINPNYLYRLAKEADEEGAVRKDEKRYYPTEKTATAISESGKSDPETTGDGE